MSRGRDVVVIGGGIVGLCSAYYLLEMGHRVTLVERGGPGHDSCSLGNGGMVVPSHFIPLAAPGMVSLGLRMMLDPSGPFRIRPRLDLDLLAWMVRFARTANTEHVERSAPLLRDLHLASRACFEDLAERFGNGFGLMRNGLLMLCKTARTLEEEANVAAQARELGLDVEVLEARDLARLDSGIRMDVSGAVHFRQDCHLAPQRLLSDLTDAVLAGGGNIQWNAKALGWQAKTGRIEFVETSRGPFGADEFVLAGGAWSAALLRPLGVRLSLQAGKGYSLTLADPPELPTICSILTEARVAVTPMGGSLRFAGTLEVGGLDLSIDRRRLRGLVRSVSDYLPAFTRDQFDGVPTWTGLRPCSPDGLPYIGRLGRCPNLIVATGHAMMGLSLGPITGKLVSEVISSETPSIALDALGPDR